MTDLDRACELLDLARHAISDPGKRIERTKGVLFGEDASRLVRDWEDRKRRARDITPAHVRHHQNEAERAIAT